MKLTVLYFAAARERVGLAREAWEFEGRTVGQFLDALRQRHPALGPLIPHLRVAVNQAVAGGEIAIPDGAEVALIPPVAGGAGAFRITAAPLSLDEVIAAVRAPERGAVVTFSGAVRTATRGRPVVRLEYEAYAPMAERVLAQLGQDVARRWPGTQLAIVHRVGTLNPGECAVVIAAAAPHRAEAFAACELAIEQLKKDAPIWKKEVFADGEVWVGLGP